MAQARPARGGRSPHRRWAAAVAALAVLALPACQVDAPAAADTPVAATVPAAPAVTVTTDPPLGAVDVDPVTPLTVRSTHGTLTQVTVTDDDGTPLTGTMAPDGSSWVATDALDFGTTYAVQASGRGAGAPADVAGQVRTVTPRTYTLPTVYPTADTGTVGVGQPITVTFDERITDRAAVERALHVTTTPPVEGAWSWFGDRSVHFRPKEYWPAHTHVVVDVDTYGVPVGRGISGEASRHVEFDVGARKVATVDADEDVLRLHVDGELVRTMPTSLGKDGTPTPSGTYVVMQQSRRYTMDSSTYGVEIDDEGGYRTEVEYASRLSDSGIFVHAAPWSVRDQGRRNVSHGCLNVSVADAGWFYENFGRGDVVEVTGAGATLPTWDGFGDWNAGWDRWLAGSALAAPGA